MQIITQISKAIYCFRNGKSWGVSQFHRYPCWLRTYYSVPTALWDVSSCWKISFPLFPVSCFSMASSRSSRHPPPGTPIAIARNSQAFLINIFLWSFCLNRMGFPYRKPDSPLSRFVLGPPGHPQPPVHPVCLPTTPLYDFCGFIPS